MPMNTKPQPTKRQSFRVAVAQLNAVGAIERNLDRIASFVEEAKRRRADAVLFPECATTGYRCDFSALRKPKIRQALLTAGEIARAHRLNLLLGSPVFKGRTLYNCLVVFDRSGKPVHCYAKCQLTPGDAKVFEPGNALSLFELDGLTATAIICHERRYPELARIPVMLGARILFHPNAGLDALAVSKAKRGGRDGAEARAFENAIYYAFANTVGPQGNGKWSAGDSKIVGPDLRKLAWAGNEQEQLAVATLTPAKATGRYALEGMRHPKFMAATWNRMAQLAARQARQVNRAWLEAIRDTG